MQTEESLVENEMELYFKYAKRVSQYMYEISRLTGRTMIKAKRIKKKSDKARKQKLLMQSIIENEKLKKQKMEERKERMLERKAEKERQQQEKQVAEAQRKKNQKLSILNVIHQKPEKEIIGKKQLPLSKKQGSKQIGDEVINENQKQGQKGDPIKLFSGKPEAPIDAFQWFLKLKKNEIKSTASLSKDFTKIPKMMKTLFDNLKPEEKKEYEEKARLDKERFEREQKYWYESKKRGNKVFIEMGKKNENVEQAADYLAQLSRMS